MSRFNEDGSEYFGAASASMHMLLVENKKLGN